MSRTKNLLPMWMDEREILSPEARAISELAAVTFHTLVSEYVPRGWSVRVLESLVTSAVHDEATQEITRRLPYTGRIQ